MTPATLPQPFHRSNIDPVGYSELEGRPAFKMAIREVRGRWYLYTGHFWHSGWSVVDVTDPAAPQVRTFVPGPKNTATLQVDLAGDTMVTSLENILPGFGGDPDAPFDEGVLIWDISDPMNPRRRGHFCTGGKGTHRNLYAGGRYVHLAAGMAGYDGNIYVIVDIGDPTHPIEAGRWWVPGQHTAAGEKPAEPYISLHGPPYVVGSQAYLPYGSAGLIVLDISDISQPRQIRSLRFSPPFHAQFGVHGVFPDVKRGIAYLNSEDVSYGKGPLHHASIVDISDPSKPWLLSLFPHPVPPPDVPYRDFFTAGGWSGPHNMNHLQHNPDVEQQGDLFYLTYFNAGLRIYDVANPRQPLEVGYFLPPDPRQRYGPMPEGPLAVQSEDVLVDRRGFIYITGKNQGLWVLRFISSSN